MGGREKKEKHSLLPTDGAGCRERSRLVLSDVCAGGVYDEGPFKCGYQLGVALKSGEQVLRDR